MYQLYPKLPSHLDHFKFESKNNCHPTRQFAHWQLPCQLKEGLFSTRWQQSQNLWFAHTHHANSKMKTAVATATSKPHNQINTDTQDWCSEIPFILWLSDTLDSRTLPSSSSSLTISHFPQRNIIPELNRAFNFFRTYIWWGPRCRGSWIPRGCTKKLPSASCLYAKILAGSAFIICKNLFHDFAPRTGDTTNAVFEGLSEWRDLTIWGTSSTHA